MTEVRSLALSSRAEPLAEQTAAELRAIVGAQHLLESPADRFAYARDRMPWALFRLRAGELPASLPAAIVLPGSKEGLVRIVTAANRRRVSLIPFGAGSGVLGGALPLSCEVIVDMKRMNRIVDIGPLSCMVRVQAGMNGAHFEAESLPPEASPRITCRSRLRCRR